MWWCSRNTTILFPTYSLSFPISYFSWFWSEFHVAVWRHFWAPISSNLIYLESSRCLVSIDSGLVRFGITVAKISHLEERWRSVGNSATLFLKKIHFSQYVADIVEPFFWEVVGTSYFNLVQMDCSNCCSIGIGFCVKTAPKTTLFYLKIVKHLIRVSEFYWYLIRFNFVFGSWTIISKGKIWPIRWSKI